MFALIIYFLKIAKKELHDKDYGGKKNILLFVI